jgi:hypothetical protein
MRIVAAARLALLVILLSGSSSSSAFAVTMGFEGLAPPAYYTVPFAPYTEAGFTLTNSLDLASESDGIFDSAAGYVNNGTDHFAWCGDCDVNPLSITLTENSASLFNLTSFEGGNLEFGIFQTGEQFVVTGHLLGGGTVVQSFDIIQDTLTVFALGSGFSNLTSVDFSGSSPSSGSHLTFDNLVIRSIRVVPEPGTGLLLGMGLFALAGSRRSVWGAGTQYFPS